MVNFKQIQEVFVEALAIYLKYIEAFLRQIGVDAISNALAVTKPDKQIPQSSHTCRFEGW